MCGGIFLIKEEELSRVLLDVAIELGFPNSAAR